MNKIIRKKDIFINVYILNMVDIKRKAEIE